MVTKISGNEVDVAGRLHLLRSIGQTPISDLWELATPSAVKTTSSRTMATKISGNEVDVAGRMHLIQRVDLSGFDTLKHVVCRKRIRRGRASMWMARPSMKKLARGHSVRLENQVGRPLQCPPELEPEFLGIHAHGSTLRATSTTASLRLELYANHINGTIPRELGKLRRLVSFDLYRNHLSGTIPKSFGHLNSLRFLRVSQNNLGGAIPASLGNLTSLEILDFSDNLLAGTIRRGNSTVTTIIQDPKAPKH
ncbi:hypothetical protein L484_017500 [Morus notabilis]|uniref:LRR receptor-like serine/threonine-protein kinase n=1 Tax=Morus notabilis TaxID=981085 RepID=W9QWB9_9ROSA|nr:hypothetical protein L484_017500 [Morus notabilis]